jgi:hypothetical protein
MPRRGDVDSNRFKEAHLKKWNEMEIKSSVSITAFYTILGKCQGEQRKNCGGTQQKTLCAVAQKKGAARRPLPMQGKLYAVRSICFSLR